MSIIRVRDKNGNIIDIPAIKGNDYILTEVDKENIANKTTDLIQQAECIPLGSAENKLAKFIDGTTTEITAEDLAGATNIRSCAFYGAPVTSIVIPDSVTSIGNYAFNECERLASVIIPNSVTSIGNRVFYLCSSLTSVTIPDSVTSIGSSAFSDCRSLASVTIGNSVTSIGGYTFDNCKKLTSVTIGNSVTSISTSAFQYCSSLTSITIPDSVTSISSSALQIGSATNKATITFLRATPPSLSSSAFKADYLNKIIVPAGSGEAYKTATNWANYADYIEEATE